MPGTLSLLSKNEAMYTKHIFMQPKMNKNYNQTSVLNHAIHFLLGYTLCTVYV